MRLLILAICATTWLACPAHAQQPARPGDWAAEPVPELAGQEAPLTASLWLPWTRADGSSLYGAATGTHAALLKADQEGEHTFVLLHGFVRLDEERPLDPTRATLRAGEEELQATGHSLGDYPAGRRALVAEEGRGLLSYLLSFPAIDPAWSVVEVTVPWLHGEEPPLRVTFFRVRERLQQVEADLAAWIAYTQLPDVRICSAIAPYLACEGYERFVARREAYTVPYLLRELARQTPTWREGVLPRFLIFHVLSQTEWGRAQGLSAAGNDADARDLLQRWRRANAPRLPTVDPQTETTSD
jgi:hypothetical protein